MLQIRKSQERGLGDHGWLKSRHSFSFAGYFDPNFMGFRSLRVINEDHVAPGRGFGKHPHRDMEIISYVVEGALEHADSMGNGSIVKPGDIQRMTAGTGVMHSEYNHSKKEPVHFLQIWIEPNQARLEPGYEQKTFTQEQKQDGWVLFASKDGREGSILIHQDVDLYGTILKQGEERTFIPAQERYTWIQVIKGSVELNGERLEAGDAAYTKESEALSISAKQTAELLLFDLS